MTEPAGSPRGGQPSPSGDKSSSPSSRSAPSPPSARVERALQAIAALACLAHVGAHVYLLRAGRYFATEDDGYRVYQGFLIATQGWSDLVGRFWLPGQFVAIAGLLKLGVAPALAPLVIGVAAMAATLASVRSIAADLAPPGWGRAAGWGAVAVAALSPLEAVLTHSALAEPLANACLALSAAALVRHHAGGPRALVAAGTFAMLMATWVRYETWAYALLFVGATYALARRRADPRDARAETLVASLALAGPLAWCGLQWATWQEPFAFIRTVDDMSGALAGPPSQLRASELRLGGLALWAPATLLFAMAACATSRETRARLRPLALFAAVGLPGLALQIISGKGLGVFIVGGREIDFFSPRLVSNVEIALFPLAGFGVAALAARSTPVARVASAVLSAFAALALALALRRPMAYVDADSIQAGLLLRRGALDGEVGTSLVLVERESPRPPMGWASLGVLWGKWPRIVWATAQPGHWLLVRPEDVKNDRERVGDEGLPAWLDANAVNAAWVLSPRAQRELESAWPAARATRIGRGVLLSRVPAVAAGLPGEARR